jgi:hypothetical protein
MAGELVTIVPSFEGVGSVMRRAPIWLKAKPQKTMGAIQNKCFGTFSVEQITVNPYESLAGKIEAVLGYTGLLRSSMDPMSGSKDDGSKL